MNFESIRDKYSRVNNPLDHSPYRFVQMEELSPIEKIVWSDIRFYGLPNFYMQLPILNYFVDFANPQLKIIIECDGKEFHSNWEKDERRQSEIEALDWKFYRVDGSACNRTAQHVFSKHHAKGLYQLGSDKTITDFYEMSIEFQNSFAEKFWELSSELLIIHLKKKYFK